MYSSIHLALLLKLLLRCAQLISCRVLLLGLWEALGHAFSGAYLNHSSAVAEL